jgi:hypothetical protein
VLRSSFEPQLFMVTVVLALGRVDGHRSTALLRLVGAMAAFGSVWWFGESLSPLGRLMLGSGVLLLVYAWVLLYVMALKGLYMDLLRALLWRSSREVRLGKMIG